MPNDWDAHWVTIRAASRLPTTDRRNAAMRNAHGTMTLSDIANAARLSYSQTWRIVRTSNG